MPDLGCRRLLARRQENGLLAALPRLPQLEALLRAAGPRTSIIFDLETHDAKKIADTDRSERDPMWIGDKVYFSSDRDGTLNLYAYDVASGGVAAHRRKRQVGRALAELRQRPRGSSTSSTASSRSTTSPPPSRRTDLDSRA